ncbi:MAG: pyridoxal phosphate-dependent aminotransferase family protein [bacterium]|nr:pyridoxal phosphate-dependent aminotransferase family protein [bacterium]
MLKLIETELKRLTESRTLRELHVRTAQTPGKITIKGKKLTDFTNWDFLNLNHESKFIKAFQKEAEETGVGSMAARASSGTLPTHFSLEKSLAGFLSTESALLFSSSNQVILSLVSSLLGEGDCVIVDERLHGRVLDAAVLVHAETLHFDTSNPDSLARAIKLSQPYKKKLIFCESINPFNGDVLDLKSVIELTNQENIPFIIDESYSLGILGIRGAGILDGANIPLNLLCRFASLSYGLGSYGAFLAGSRSITEYLLNRSRTFTTECSLPPALAAATETGINIVELAAGKRERLNVLSNHIRSLLKLSGFNLETESNTPIILIPFNKRSIAKEIADGLFQKGYFVEVVNPGQLLESGAAIRIILNSAHKEKDLDELFVTFTDLNKRVNKS